MLFLAGSWIICVLMIFAYMSSSTACITSIYSSLLWTQYRLLIIQNSFYLWNFRFNFRYLIANCRFNLLLDILTDLVYFAVWSFCLGMRFSISWSGAYSTSLGVLLFDQFLLFKLCEFVFAEWIWRQELDSCLSFFSFRPGFESIRYFVFIFLTSLIDHVLSLRIDQWILPVLYIFESIRYSWFA